MAFSRSLKVSLFKLLSALFQREGNDLLANSSTMLFNNYLVHLCLKMQVIRRLLNFDKSNQMSRRQDVNHRCNIRVRVCVGDMFYVVLIAGLK